VEAGSYLGDRCVELVTAAAPGLPITERRDPWHGVHARADLPDAQSVRFAYLFPSSGAHLSLALYPADTLGQARVFYSDPLRVDGVLALRDDSWRIEPNFHFGSHAKGLTWTRSALDVDAYAAYWMDRIGSLAAFPRDDWKHELNRLVEEGVFDRNDLTQFERDFTTTKRPNASPRPGLRVQRSWPLTEALDEDFAERALRSALSTALSALGEYRSREAVAT
jgi:hypothetical protein